MQGGAGLALVSGSGSALVSGSGSGSALASGSGSALVSGSGSALVSGSGLALASGSGLALASGSGSGSALASGSGSALASGSGSALASGSGSALAPAPSPPLRASALAAGFDLRAAEDCIVPPGGAATLVRTGLAFALPPGSVGIVKSRSSLAARHDVEAGAGVIDADYRGEVRVLLRNFGTGAFQVRAGDRIAQLVVLPLYPLSSTPRQETLEQLGETERGAGGFGSTGAT